MYYTHKVFFLNFWTEPSIYRWLFQMVGANQNQSYVVEERELANSVNRIRLIVGPMTVQNLILA